MAALDRLGVAGAVACASAPIYELSARTPQDRAILRVDLRSYEEEGLHVPRLPTRTVLQSALLEELDGVEVRLACRMVTHTVHCDRVSVDTDNGCFEAADLLVIADGIWSRIGAEVTGGAVRHCGYGGILALSDPAPGACEVGTTCEFWGRDDRFGLFDVGADRTYWFLMRTERRATDHAAISRDTVVALLDAWPDRLGLAVRATPVDRLIPFSIHARDLPSRLSHGRIIAVGDAAHAMEPNLGQGGCQALEDAVALSAVARRVAPEQVGALFDRLRLARVRQFMRSAREAGYLAQRRHGLATDVGRRLVGAAPNALTRARVRALHRLPDYDRMIQAFL